MRATMRRRRAGFWNPSPNRAPRIAGCSNGRSKAATSRRWRAVAHKMLPIFTMLGAAGVAATLRTAESWEGPLTDALRGEIGAAAENIRAIVAEAQKKVSLP